VGNACQLLRYESDILMTEVPDTIRDEIIDKTLADNSAAMAALKL